MLLNIYVKDPLARIALAPFVQSGELDGSRPSAAWGCKEVKGIGSEPDDTISSRG